MFSEGFRKVFGRLSEGFQRFSEGFRKVFGMYVRRQKRKSAYVVQTLKWAKVPEDSSVFDDFWTELIVLTLSVI